MGGTVVVHVHIPSKHIYCIYITKLYYVNSLGLQLPLADIKSNILWLILK